MGTLLIVVRDRRAIRRPPLAGSDPRAPVLNQDENR
jgi:hypothetical protein